MEDIFNNHYINLFEKASEMKPVNVAILNVLSDNDKITNIIIEPYENDHSVKRYLEKQLFHILLSFTLLPSVI